MGTAQEPLKPGAMLEELLMRARYDAEHEQDD